jgi:hypothetical protein
VSETLSTLGLKMLAQRLIVERDALNSDIGNGQCKSFDDYRFQVGRIKGLSDVLEWMKDTEKELYEGPK